MQRNSKDRVRKKSVFIALRLANTALPGVCIYCSTNAGINMFAHCVGLELENREDGFEVISISSGMADTAMQQVARSISGDEFDSAGLFKQAFDAGKQQGARKVAKKNLYLIDNKFEQGKHLRVSDILL